MTEIADIKAMLDYLLRREDYLYKKNRLNLPKLYNSDEWKKIKVAIAHFEREMTFEIDDYIEKWIKE